MQKFDYHWRRAVNIPAWVIQLLICIYLIFAAGVWIAAAKTKTFQTVVSQATSNSSAVTTWVNTVMGVYIGVGSVTCILVILEIIFCTKKLIKPAVYLAMAVVKTLLWLVVMILIILFVGGLPIFLALAILLTCVAQLSYGATVVHKQRKGTLTRGTYAPAATGHVEGALYNPHLAPVPAPTQYGYAGSTNTEYKSPVPSPAPEQQYGYTAPAASHSYYSPDSYGQQQQQQQQQHQYSGYQQPPAGTYEMQNRPHH